MRDIALSKMNLLFAPPPANIPPSPSSSANENVELKKSESDQIKELTEKVHIFIYLNCSSFLYFNSRCFQVALLEVQLAKEKKTISDLKEAAEKKKKKSFF